MLCVCPFVHLYSDLSCAQDLPSDICSLYQNIVIRLYKSSFHIFTVLSYPWSTQNLNLPTIRVQACIFCFMYTHSAPSTVQKVLFDSNWIILFHYYQVRCKESDFASLNFWVKYFRSKMVKISFFKFHLPQKKIIFSFYFD